MSASSTFPHPQGLGYAHLASKWGWFVALGIVMIAGGMFALGGDLVAFTIISTIFIGALMLVAGIFQIIHSFAIKQWGSFLFNLLCGVVYIIGGFLIMREPIQGSFIITLFLIAAIFVGGILRIVMALRHRDVQYWWLLLLGGIVSVALAVWLFTMLPWPGLFLLGMLIAIELIFQGVGWLSLGLSLRRMHRGTAPA
jgi:uncharacterized membrane protein HdeD (DUF308 family)